MRCLKFLFVLLAAGALAAQAGPFAPLPYRAPDEMPDDRRNIPAPKERPVNVWEDAWDRQFTEQMAEMFDFSRLVRKVGGSPKEALNVDAFDDVRSSSWFTHRSGTGRLVADSGSACPDTVGDWTIFKAKMTGMAPGMFIKDAYGRRFIIKFDPKGYSELSTGAEVVNARFLHAAGFNVPMNCIVHFRSGQVKVGDGVSMTDSRGRKRNMTAADLKELFEKVEILPDGRIRAAASGFIPGKGLGPFLYKGTRPDDPNDFIPHEHRREVRGLRVIYAWLKRFDINSGNTYDSHVEEDGRRFVKHYLIDFGGDLGASLYGPTPRARGYENVFDPHQIGINILTLGLLVPPWERADTAVSHPAVGRYDSHNFDPAGFKFITPAKAFELLTDRDGYWGAKIVMSFDDALIRSLVAQGAYRDSNAVEYFVSRIKERRDMTGRYWFGRVASLDSLRIEDDGPGTLRFTDLAVTSGFEAAGHSEYRYTIRNGDGSEGVQDKVGNDEEKGNGKPGVTASKSLVAPGGGIPLPSLNPGRPTLAVDIEVARKNTSKRMRVHLKGDDDSGKWRLLGVERE